MPIQRGEIYFVNLNPVRGREQAAPKGYPRPVLVLSIDVVNRLPLVVTVVVGLKTPYAIVSVCKILPTGFASAILSTRNLIRWRMICGRSTI
jgi:mRNA-degrading endonuclease toxin of MazEF toxin-antitoxin module